jgi:hypothetical protein
MSDAPLCEAEHFLEGARQSFRLAAASIQAKDIEHHAGVGRDYLRRAHEAAEVVPVKPNFRAGGSHE